MRQYKGTCSGTTSGLYRHYKRLVAQLQAICSPATKAFVRICCLQLDGRKYVLNQFFYYQRQKRILVLFTLISL